MATFEGFPKRTITFLDELRMNNNSDWFQDHKKEYETWVIAPSLQFISAMSEPLAEISGEFEAVPKPSGGSLMRMRRDARFSSERSPYKTTLGIQFRHRLGRNAHAPGFYFHLNPERGYNGAGMWHPASAELKLIRAAIDEKPDEYRRAIERSRPLELQGESLKRPPAGYRSDHPLIGELKRKDFLLSADIPLEIATSERLVRVVTDHFRKASGLISFLCEALDLPY